MLGSTRHQENIKACHLSSFISHFLHLFFPSPSHTSILTPDLISSLPSLSPFISLDLVLSSSVLLLTSLIWLSGVMYDTLPGPAEQQQPREETTTSWTLYSERTSLAVPHCGRQHWRFYTIAQNISIEPFFNSTYENIISFLWRINWIYQRVGLQQTIILITD